MSLDDTRRMLVGLGAGAALATLPWAVRADSRPAVAPRQTLLAVSYGAKGDGANDDTAALQAALDAAFAPGGSGFLEIPPGT